MMNRKYALALIVAIAVVFSMIPHLDYSYPLHVDEWYHIYMAEEILQGNMQYDLEIGWHFLLALMIGISSPDLTAYRFLPAIFAAAGVLSVYFFVRRWGEDVGLISAFFAAILPTSLAFGGPALLMPAMLGVILIPMAMRFAFDARSSLREYAVLGGIVLFALVSHPPTAAIMILVLFMYSILEFRKTGGKVLLTVIIALVFSSPLYVPVLQSEGVNIMTFPFWLKLQNISYSFGLLPTTLFIAGIYLMTKGKCSEKWTIIFSSLALLSIIILYLATGYTWLIPYQRVYLSLMMLMGIVAAFATLKLPRALILPVLTMVLFISFQSALSVQYYHVVDNNDVSEFYWIRDNTPTTALIVMNPWKARAFTTVSHREPYSIVPFGPIPSQMERVTEASEFFSGGCVDEGFIRGNNISLVYHPCPSVSFLEKMRGNVYTVIS